MTAAIAGLVFAAGANAGRGDAEARPYLQVVERTTDAAEGGGTLRPASIVAQDADLVVRGVYIVQLSEPSVASYRGGTSGYAPIPRLAGRANRADMHSSAARQYAGHLRAQQNRFVSGLESRFGKSFKTFNDFQYAFNGVALRLDAQELEFVRALRDVRLVEPLTLHKLDTDAGPGFIGAPEIWNGNATGGAPGTAGEGVVIGVIDSGVNWESPSFADVGGDGYDHTNPLGNGNYLGVCATQPPDADTGPACNDKLIGAYAKSFAFVQQVNAECADPGNPANELELTPADCTSIGVPLVDFDNALDENGHGSHTASTSGGNQVDITYLGNNVTISGVAKHANLISYDACHTNISGQGSCFNIATLDAIEQVVEDGIVDVINYSIGGGTSPWTQANSIAFLSAVDAGVFVATSAGNSGPDAATLGHLEPWTSTTAASTHTRGAYALRYTANGATVPTTPAVASKQLFLGTAGGPHDDALNDVPVRISPNIDTAASPPAFLGDGCAPYAGTPFAGAVAVIRRGGCNFSIKVVNAQAAGAISVIIANNQAGEIAPAGAQDVPFAVFGTNQVNANALRDYVNVQNAGTATITIPLTAVSEPVTGDVMADFSSRGPSPIDALKPDITGPGVNILAAYVGADPSTPAGASDPAGYDIISGTSMSSPHNAGSAALVRSVHPEWSVAEVKSALMLTSKFGGIVKEDGLTTADPFDRGAGRLDLTKAAETGLVMDETPLRMFMADPAEDGDPSALNLPSIQSSACIESCEFTRKVRSVAAAPVTYTATFASADGVTAIITPATFTIAPGAEQTLNIKFDVGGATLDAFNFGDLVLTPQTTLVHTEASPAAPPIAIPDDQYAGGFNVAGQQACIAVDTTGDVAGNISTAEVDIAATHPWIGDLTIKLGAPNGQVLGLMSIPGLAEAADDGVDASVQGENLNPAFPITFRDSAPTSAEAMGTQGNNNNANICGTAPYPCVYSPAPGSIAQPPSNLAGLGGQPGAGIWRVCMGDSFAGDAGTFTGFTLRLYSQSVPTIHMPVALFGAQAVPDIEVSPASITANAVEGGAAVTRALDIENVGFADLNWNSTSATSISSLPVYSQLMTLADNPGSGFSTGTYATPAGPGVFLADSFTLTAEQAIGSIYADGFTFTDAAADAYQNLSIYVFPNQVGTPDVPAGNPASSPGSALFSYSGGVGDPGLSIDQGPFLGSIRLDLGAAGEALTLPAGKYWLVVAPENTTFGGVTTDEWFWLGTGPTRNLDDAAMIIDTGNRFNAAILDWEPLEPLLQAPNNARFRGLSLEIAGAVTCGAPWLSTTPTSGTVAAGDAQTIQVNFNPTGLASGTYNAVLCVASNDPFEPVSGVPVTFNVTGSPTAPSGIGAAAPDTVAVGGVTLLTVDVEPGTNPASTGLVVRADLTSIGGSAAQSFVDDGTGGDATAADGIYSYTANVTVGTALGVKSLPATITDAQARTANTTIALTVTAATAPSGVGLATPSTVESGDVSLLTVTVTQGSPASTGLSVVVDLGDVGGSATQQMFDDGSNGDVTAGDGVFSFEAHITGPAGDYALEATIADAQARTATAVIDITISPPPGEVIFVDGFED